MNNTSKRWDRVPFNKIDILNGKYCWSAMIKRCLNKKSRDFKNYGAKGIKVSKRWLKYSNFIKDMGFRPSSSHSIDRIDRSKGYYKSNCRWATPKQQTDNRRIAHECYKGHPWTNENTILTNNGVSNTRRCKICYLNRINSLKNKVRNIK